MLAVERSGDVFFNDFVSTTLPSSASAKGFRPTPYHLVFGLGFLWDRGFRHFTRPPRPGPGPAECATGRQEPLMSAIRKVLRFASVRRSPALNRLYRRLAGLVGPRNRLMVFAVTPAALSWHSHSARLDQPRAFKAWRVRASRSLLRAIFAI